MIPKQQQPQPQDSPEMLPVLISEPVRAGTPWAGLVAVAMICATAIAIMYIVTH